jgi:hypothetical protein
MYAKTMNSFFSCLNTSSTSFGNTDPIQTRHPELISLSFKLIIQLTPKKISNNEAIAGECGSNAINIWLGNCLGNDNILTFV